MDLERAKTIAVAAVKQSGRLLMDNLEKVKAVSFKGKRDIVTEIDFQPEKIIVSSILKNFPGHKILSEEKGTSGGSSKYLWIIDPIDGTINYYHASAPFRIGLCLLESHTPILSVIYNPVKDQLFLAEKGRGATLNGQKIKTSDNQELKNAIVLTHLSSKKGARIRTIAALEKIFEKTMHLRIFGCGLAAMTYVATGKFDIYFNVKTYSWDILPGALLVSEAKGKVTDIQGNEISNRSTSVLATNGKIHDQMLKLLKNI
ncbi:hypothetical protein COS81_00135 [candidate division WWE3 bacterium CG06_land_8_20_14_3_00_42_16]|uniref:Inositol-1-monophosphatase n=4 Tax=Katanobacteria TaxID=422282 RepID=A0A2M7APQ7_UNCKA|nr:MAG: hypothetical protein AUJ38_00630 [bacterium CG1_02_42_9]PIU69363.1 MAG: hypothetical protein COS81_00135 [candidate division WWE3 bacterium CG06_land_8_20_14_3_00_42_16]PIZ43474.1 MAG: hypothetical protein COY34_00795 [candidate division WWE3 bacterium CG_4_10_14_0_2_um_filter_42_8]PJA37378.1 MAG: hypothetical protein CO181_03760 [candidate division WWE3 bacterium CG_4_9_14_3_um_filter_43_9]PJC69216.1 MAG: hypothetical protein CO015_01155 [candidate division WWE3 bacterium CG_4_8_14_3_u